MDGFFRYDRDAVLLRKALAALRDNGIGAELLLQQMEATHGRPKDPRDAISRPALAEFINGRQSKKVVALAALWAFLRAHPVYRGYFSDAPAPVDASAFAAAVAGFFTDARVPPTFASPESLRRLFAGRFVLYRPDWSARHGAGFHRVSLLEITAGDNGYMQITETQDFPDETPPLFQTAIGTLFSYGPFAYFLLREDEPAGRRVMFGAFREAHPVPDLVPHGKSLTVEWFSGFVAASSMHGLSARERFVCRRHDPKHPVGVGVMKLNEATTDAETLGLLKSRPPWL